MLEEKIYMMEKSGRDKFKTLCSNLNLNYIESTNPYEYYDGIIYFNGKKYIVELKDRSDKYVYDTILFEDEKYQNLKKSIKDLNADGAYYISIWNNTLYIYMIPEIMNIKPVKINANKCTAASDYKKEKLVYFIPKADHKVYTI